MQKLPQGQDAEQPKLIEEVAPLNLKGDEVYTGNKNAKMVFVTYTDFQCPFCAKFHPTLKSLFEKNAGTLLVFKHYPLPFHQYAKDFALMFECVAKNQNFESAIKFGDNIFASVISSQGNFAVKEATDLFLKTGLSNDTLNNCKNDSTLTKKIADNLNEGSELGIQGTPALYIINTQSKKAIRINGALDESTIQAEFDKLNK